MPSRLAITTMSLGRCWAGHSFEHKMDMAAKYGYQGIELWHEDLMDVAEQLPGGAALPENQLAAAGNVKRMCDARNIEIITLQPFMNFEGLVDREQHARRVEELRFWIQLAHVLGTDLIQIPSNILPADQVSEDLDLHIADLTEVADIGAASEPPIRFSYESLSWGTRVDVWERCWEVVQRVDRPNFGMCLDTFHIAGRIFADPAAASGKVPDAEQAVKESMQRMLSTVDVSKILYVQVVDGERLAEPISETHPFYDPAQPPRMSWSRNCRLFYGEYSRGAHLPVREICAAIFQGLGFEGWVSFELFNRRMSEEDHDVPEELAKRGAVSWTKFVRDMKLRVDEPSKTTVTASL
ncbi:xylose isomerase-like TIM barrel [Colletotrichum eremochloae]|uniref:Putative xylose isomerase-like TIM barrel n=1 Tax=Colletotrichum sublineola TaxID=1173701 RepID=A0A066X3W7_COLSU|nr:xylose isomerase-like TIM barrel [Colletotrichum sublineola]KAK2017267.1 xylose isomerase-like TIM barrel [Colletotrichum eremochloae]KDN60451.1 putative xylose isomerase-like TIM barrel [Colletotrichum sublineola]